MSDKFLYKILVVEDDFATIEIIRSQLDERYLVSYVTTKNEAMTLMRTESFQLVLLDIVLPDGSGMDICHEIKSNHEQYGEVGIIIITGVDDPNTEVEGLRIGANDYITKPVHTAVLGARIEMQVQLLRKTQLLEELARIDGLTEIPNRRAYDHYLERSWNHARRISVPISLAIIDVDFFKQYNDIYGHPAGDHCLRQVAQCLDATVKRGSDHIARIGGEEFAVLLFDCDLDNAKNVMENIRQRFEALEIEHEGSAISKQVTLSIGVCTAYPDIDDRDSLHSAADTLLYRAKKEGRNRIVSDYFHRVDS